MVAYTDIFVCDNCGEEFLGMEWEVDATCKTKRTPCPHCGCKFSHRKTFLDKILGIFKRKRK